MKSAMYAALVVCILGVIPRVVIGDSWRAPACGVVRGAGGGVTFTTDDGRTLAPTAPRPDGIAYTYGLAAYGTPNRMVAEHGGRLFRSTDAGCTWRASGLLKGAPYTFTAAVDGQLYGWTQNGSGLARITTRSVKTLRSPVSANLCSFEVPGFQAAAQMHARAMNHHPEVRLRDIED